MAAKFVEYRDVPHPASPLISTSDFQPPQNLFSVESMVYIALGTMLTTIYTVL